MFDEEKVGNIPLYVSFYPMICYYSGPIGPILCSR